MQEYLILLCFVLLLGYIFHQKIKPMANPQKKTSAKPSRRQRKAHRLKTAKKKKQERRAAKHPPPPSLPRPTKNVTPEPPEPTDSETLKLLNKSNPEAIAALVSFWTTAEEPKKKRPPSNV